ncbi:MAG: DUF342 domain-containing protein [Nitrosomonadales bacterium]|nr:DUF342 domain-containing protein [Nitrosomonadales bacterium]
MLIRSEGVFINLTPPPAQDILRLFVDRLFDSGAYFEGLDYAAFIRLLYGDIPATPGTANEIHIARDIVRFMPQRRELYRSVKITDAGDRAEYIFEPLFIEVTTEEPIYGEPGSDGNAPITGHKRRTESRPTKLSFDEFVADMWIKGVRYGINADLVCNAIANNTAGRLDFAFQLAPTDSNDARVIEESDTLRQDNAPLILPNGKADLRRARNRFPQVAKNAPLLRKIPRALGKPGYKVSGEIMEARLPEDIDLRKLGGEGTRIDRIEGGELLVANMDGFVVIDETSGEIWITTRIENKGGISAKSTGDIRLAVDQFVEHGEVQEGRVVEGKHMTFHSNVYGSIVSEGGNIQLESNLSGGRARSTGGNVNIKGRAFSALIEAWDGSITLGFAESCTIIGKTVSIERAVNCEIVADDVQIGVAEGSAIAGKRIRIASSSARKDKETAIAILVPDFSSYDQQISRMHSAIADIRHTLKIKSGQMNSLRANPKIARILDMGDKIRSGQIRLTPEQQVEWNKVVDQFAPMMKESAYLMEKCQKLEGEIERLSALRQSSANGECCDIAEVVGETVVRMVHTNEGTTAIRPLPAHALTTFLRHPVAAQDRIFSDTRSSLTWQFKVPEPSSA